VCGPTTTPVTSSPRIEPRPKCRNTVTAIAATTNSNTAESTKDLGSMARVGKGGGFAPGHRTLAGEGNTSVLSKAWRMPQYGRSPSAAVRNGNHDSLHFGKRAIPEPLRRLSQ